VASCPIGTVIEAPRIRIVDREHCVATWDRVLLQIWRLEVTQGAVDELYKIGRQFVSEHKEPLNMLTIVEPTSPAPSDKVRASLSGLYRELAPNMKEQIVVAEGSGFRSALVRSVGIALSTIAPRSLPFKFVSSVDEAASMIRPHLSPKATVEHLHGAIRDIRAQMT
jgi:hypothetical protein